MLPKYALELFDIGSAQGQGNITQNKSYKLNNKKKPTQPLNKYGERKGVGRKNKSRFCTRVSSKKKVLSA